MTPRVATWLRLAVAQLPMTWTVAGNLQSILLALEQAARSGARLCVLPELALSGFHRDIAAQSTRARILPALAEVQAACARLGLAAALGLPWTEADGRCFNRMAFIGACGQWLGHVDKQGLTESEALFFTPGPQSRSVIGLAGLRCSAVLCREVEDVDALAPELRRQEVDLLLWPSYIAWPPLAPHQAPDYGPAAALMARQCAASVLQCNWPHALNDPATRGMGGSRWIDSNGRVRAQAPLDHSGLAILHEDRFDWQPLLQPNALSA